jgi:hypothetical protein
MHANWVRRPSNLIPTSKVENQFVSVNFSCQRRSSHQRNMRNTVFSPKYGRNRQLDGLHLYLKLPMALHLGQRRDNVYTTPADLRRPSSLNRANCRRDGSPDHLLMKLRRRFIGLTIHSIDDIYPYVGSSEVIQNE